MNRIASFFLVFFIISCKNTNERNKLDNLIKDVETHLAPKIQISGQPQTFFTIQERMEFYKVPGVSIAIIDNGEIQWVKGFGHLTTDNKRVINERTLFQAASISKPVSAMGALKLVEEKKVSLNNSVNEYLKEWKILDNEFTEKEKVTLKRLLSHSAGLTVHGFRGYAKGEEVPNIVQILNGEKPANSDYIQPYTTPGVEFKYSGGGYTVVQKLITDISNTSFEIFMDQTVLKKLRMNSSTFAQPISNMDSSNVSVGHKRSGDVVKGNWHTYPEMAAAGLWTTPTDLAKFVIEIQKSLNANSNKILSKELAEKMTTRDFKNYGLGFAVEGKGDSIRFVHGGANEGFRCRLVAFKNFGKGIIIMTNSDNGGKLISEILRSISYIYGWGIYPTNFKSITELDFETLNEYVGKYKISKGYEAEIVNEENHLVVKELWNNNEYLLHPESENKFFKQEDGNSVVFEKDSSGIVKGYTINGRFNFQRIN